MASLSEKTLNFKSQFVVRLDLAFSLDPTFFTIIEHTVIISANLASEDSSEVCRSGLKILLEAGDGEMSYVALRSLCALIFCRMFPKMFLRALS